MTPRMLALSAALACAITPAWGSDLVTSVTRQLLKQGYSDITTSQTWLGGHPYYCHRRRQPPRDYREPAHRGNSARFLARHRRR